MGEIKTYIVKTVAVTNITENVKEPEPAAADNLIKCDQCGQLKTPYINIIRFHMIPQPDDGSDGHYHAGIALTSEFVDSTEEEEEDEDKNDKEICKVKFKKNRLYERGDGGRRG